MKSQTQKVWAGVVLSLFAVAVFSFIIWAATSEAAELYVDGVLVNGDVDQVNVTTGGTTPPPTGSVSIDSFTAIPGTVTTGARVALTWRTSNADGCTGSATGGLGGWNGSAIPINGGTSVAMNTQGTYTFRVRCTGTDGPVTRSRVVAVQDPPSTCSPPLKGSVTNWREVWFVDWPGPAYDNERIRIPRGGFKALRFNTGNVVDNGGIISVANTSTNGVRLGSISTCAGDFDVEPECSHSWGSSGGIGWATDGEPDYCQLKPNTTYYMNFTFTDGRDPMTDSCLPGDSCYASLQHINLN